MRRTLLLSVVLTALLALPALAQRPEEHAQNTPRANQGHVPPAPAKRDNVRAKPEVERNVKGRVNETQHVNNDHWYGHESPNDKRFHLDHPFEHGHFEHFGPSYRYKVERFDLAHHRFWFPGGFGFEVASWDLPVALKASDPYSVWEAPSAGWLNFGPKTYRARGGGAKPGVPQVILNYAGPRETWRFTPVVDRVGIATSSRFLVMRAKPRAKHTLRTLWAVMLSPIANAFAYSWSGKRQTLPREWLAMPLPVPTEEQAEEIEHAAGAYLKLARQTSEFMVLAPDETAIRRALLDLDAAVLRLYDLPPALERELLSIFDGVDRPGVGCTFPGYPPGWSSRPALPTTELPQDDRPIWERIAELAERLPQEMVSELPADGASQLDHYLYGAPKTT